MRPFLFLGMIALGVVGTGAGARAAAREPARFSSSPAPAALLELYTSEGCSSCPPADRWLAALRDAPGLWRDFVPVSFHVDYWNRLGWPDKFSRPDFTAREYAYAAAWHSESVYTPCFVRDGAEWREQSRSAPVSAPSSAPPVGVLSVVYDGAVVQAHFAAAPKAAAAGGDWEIHAALLGSGIASKVAAGENRGATLHHEFVALRLVHGAPDAPLALPRQEFAGVPRQALAVWVTRRGELAVAQATGGWLEP